MLIISELLISLFFANLRLFSQSYRVLVGPFQSFMSGHKKSVILLHPLIEVFAVPTRQNDKSSRNTRDFQHHSCLVILNLANFR